MGDPVQKGCCHLAVTEYLRPFTEGQVGSNDQRRSLVELRDQVKQELTSTLGERQIAQFVEYNQIMSCHVFRQLATSVVELFLLKLVYQVKHVEESGLPSVSDVLPGNCNGQVRLASTGATYHDDVGVIGEKAAFVTGRGDM